MGTGSIGCSVSYFVFLFFNKAQPDNDISIRTGDIHVSLSLLPGHLLAESHGKGEGEDGIKGSDTNSHRLRSHWTECKNLSILHLCCPQCTLLCLHLVYHFTPYVIYWHLLPPAKDYGLWLKTILDLLRA